MRHPPPATAPYVATACGSNWRQQQQMSQHAVTWCRCSSAHEASAASDSTLRSMRQQQLDLPARREGYLFRYSSARAASAASDSTLHGNSMRQHLAPAVVLPQLPVQRHTLYSNLSLHWAEHTPATVAHVHLATRRTRTLSLTASCSAPRPAAAQSLPTLLHHTKCMITHPHKPALPLTASCPAPRPAARTARCAGCAACTP